MGYTYINVTSCFVVGISLLALSILAVGLRIFIRWRTPGRSGDTFWQTHLDDVLCLLALVPSIGTTVALTYGARKGVVGSHNEASNVESWMTTTTPDLIIIEKLVYIIFIMQPLALGFMKLSVLFFYRRIFISRTFRILSLIFIIITIGWMLAFFFGFVFDCRLNFAANWGSLAGISQNCPFGFRPTIIFTIIDAFLDLCILLLPLPHVCALQLPLARKAQVCGAFLLGGFAVAAATIRMVICIKQNIPSGAAEHELIMGMPTYDIVGITSHGLFWTVVEVNVALIACCLPIMRPIFGTAALSTGIAASRWLAQTIASMLGFKRANQATTRVDDIYSSAQVSKGSSAKDGSSHIRTGMHKSNITSPNASEFSLIELEEEFGTLASLRNYL